MVTVSRRGTARLRAGHLWVYRSDLLPRGEMPAGSLVHVCDERGRKLGSALSSSSSQIALRLLSTQEVPQEELLRLIRDRVGAAVEFRQQRVRDSDSYRVIFSESDLL